MKSEPINGLDKYIYVFLKKKKNSGFRQRKVGTEMRQGDLLLDSYHRWLWYQRPEPEQHQVPIKTRERMDVENYEFIATSRPRCPVDSQTSRLAVASLPQGQKQKSKFGEQARMSELFRDKTLINYPGVNTSQAAG